jgi:VCBS repeat-containing protein
MAITQAMCTSFKKELLEGVHNFKLSGGDTFKLALFAISGGGKSSTTATLGATTTALVTTGEVASSGTYTTGGGTLTRVDPTTSGTTAFTDFTDVSFTTATITARGALIYNSSDSNKAVAVLDFGGNKTSTSGTFTVQFPTANGSNAIIRIA